MIDIHYCMKGQQFIRMLGLSMFRIVSARFPIAEEPEISSLVNVSPGLRFLGCARFPLCFHKDQTISSPFNEGAWRFGMRSFTANLLSFEIVVTLYQTVARKEDQRLLLASAVFSR